MLNIKRLTYKNILSVGNHEIEVNFQNKQNTLIIGKNGAGKSLILSALTFALYGKDFRGITKTGIINSINKKNLLTTCEFEQNGIDYKIVRGIKPNIFDIYKNGVLLEQQASVRDQQKWFEEEVLQFPYNTFKQIVVTGSGNYTQFMKLTTPQRREFIEELLDLNVFSLMQQNLKDKISATKENIRNGENELYLCEEKIKIYEKQQESLSDNRKIKMQELESSIKTCRDEISINEKQIVELLDKLSKVENKIKAIEQKEEEKNTLQSEIYQMKKNIQSSMNDVSRIVDMDHCPTCRQSVGIDHKSSIKEETENRVSILQKELEPLESSLESLLEIVNKKNVLNAAYIQLQKSINLLEVKNSSNIDLISKAEVEKNKLLTETVKNMDDIDTFKSNKVEIIEKLSVAREKSAINDALVVLLKDTGIKAKIIKQYVGLMNKLINKYLEKFDFYVNFTIDEQFNEKIKSRHRDEFIYQNFSEGEKLRIDLSILFAFREIAKMKSSLDCNLIFFDEVLDSAMDDEGLSNLYTIFELLNDTSIYVISHRGEAVEMFDRVLCAEKVGNFSTLRTVDS